MSGNCIQNNRTVVPDAHRAQPHVEVREPDPDQADPGPLHVPAVQTTDAGVGGLARPAGPTSRRARRRRDAAASGSRTCSSAMKTTFTVRTIVPTPMPNCVGAPATQLRRPDREPHRLPGVERENDDEDEREVQGVAVDVLDDEREPALAEILLARLTDRAARRVGPERLVVGAAVVVAGEPEAQREDQDEHGARSTGGTTATRSASRARRTSSAATDRRAAASTSARGTGRTRSSRSDSPPRSNRR